MEPKPIDANNFDTSVQPSTDFYKYANGGWMKSNPLRDEFSRYGTFDKLIEENQHLLQKLLEELAAKRQQNSGVARKIGCFYASAIDEKLIETAALKPLKRIFERIKQISTINDLSKEIALFHSEGFAPIFGLVGSPDEKDSKRVITHLWQAGLGLPDRDYYTDEGDRMKNIRSEYIIYMENLHRIAGFDEKGLADSCLKVMQIETQLAKSSMTRLEQRDPHKTYNKYNFEGLQALCPQFNWKNYFSTLGLSEPGDINVNQPAFFSEINNLIESWNILDLKSYLRWNILNSSSPYLNKALVDEHFRFYGTVLSGKKELKPRWKRAIDASDEALGEAIGQIFVEKYFPPEAKKRMLELVHNLKKALRIRIQNLVWMSSATKEKAIEKLSSIKVKIGYPDKWRDYSKLEISEDSYFINVLVSSMFNYQYMLSKINKPVDPDQWHMNPQTVNAYYNPLDNEIVFPAGILQPPFFHKDADDAVNYGAIGVVIGHEMTHGFDDQGRKFDSYGNLSDWWTEEDSLKFNELTEVLVKQFNSFVVLDSVHGDGKLTLGENIADLGGLHVSFDALKMALHEKPASIQIDGFTQEQRFYLAYAHVWAQNIRDEEIQRRIKEDEHSLGHLRVIGPLRNIPAFHQAFNINVGDPMYLPENERANIW
jgi:putative endopeptidase